MNTTENKALLSSEPGKSSGISDPDFEYVVNGLIGKISHAKLASLRENFHARLRLSLSQPDKTELVEDLWDFFYDWCVFYHEELYNDTGTNDEIWSRIKSDNRHGAFVIKKNDESGLKLKELFTGDIFLVYRKSSSDFAGLLKDDMIEARLLAVDVNNRVYTFVRTPSFHQIPVHSYITKKVKQFKKMKDFATYQSWLWVLVGMYLKNRIYPQMPIDKIYDDNSRI